MLQIISERLDFDYHHIIMYTYTQWDFVQFCGGRTYVNLGYTWFNAIAIDTYKSILDSTCC